MTRPRVRGVPGPGRWQGRRPRLRPGPRRERLHDKPLPQDEAKLRELFAKIVGYGPVLVVVDQPASIGALPVTVARDVGVDVAYLPGLAMRRIATCTPATSRPTNETPTSSPRSPAPCPTRCDGSISATKRWPTWT